MSATKAMLVAVIALAALIKPVGVGAQQPWSQVGMLNCTLAPSIGLLVVAQQRMSCRFEPNPPGGQPQFYNGVMTSVGIELGAIAGGAFAWAVFASVVGAPPGSLAGTYVGTSGEITVGVGGGLNVLVGGSARSVALQPFSGEGTVGLNLQLSISNLELVPAN